MIVVDANVLIGYLDVDDAHHVAAERLLLATVDEEIAINPITPAEVLVGPTLLVAWKLPPACSSRWASWS